MSAISGQEAGPRIGYLGPQASFSHQAALEAFPGIGSDHFLALPSFQSILSEVQQSAALASAASTQNEEDSQSLDLDYALLPVENSTNGGVVQVLDLLVQSGENAKPCTYPDIEIVAEHYLKVHHCLYVHKSIVGDSPLADKTTPTTKTGVNDQKGMDFESLRIKTLYSHPQVWGQCTRFLNAHFPSWRVQHKDTSSTSAAAAFVSKHPSSTDQDEGSKAQSTTKVRDSSNTNEAQPVGSSGSDSNCNNGAICSSLAGGQNGLVRVASNIEDEPGKNTTRFLIIRNRNRSRNKNKNKNNTQEEGDEVALLPSTTTTTMETRNPMSLPSIIHSFHHNHQQQQQEDHETATENSSSLSTPKVIFYKSLITFTIPHKTAGSLASALTVFSKHAFNLTSITTRPSREEPWHYVFFIEFEFHSPSRPRSRSGNNNDDETNDDERREIVVGFDVEHGRLQNMLADLSLVTERNTLLGSWIDRLKHPVR